MQRSTPCVGMDASVAAAAAIVAILLFPRGKQVHVYFDQSLNHVGLTLGFSCQIHVVISKNFAHTTFQITISGKSLKVSAASMLEYSVM